jgi:Beta-ketoacyl synthase, N-terminal domain
MGAMIEARIMSVGLMGPGLTGWDSGQQVLDGSAAHVPSDVVPPAPLHLSARERRRTSHGVRLALAVAQEAVDNSGDNPKSLPTVLGWPHGDGPIMHRLLETLATPERYVSPTEFHNSVHNVAVGYWTIASGSHQPCSSIAAGEGTFPASLLKALAEVECEKRRVLLIVCSIPFPEPLNAVCPVGGSFGAALVLAPARETGGLARMTARYRTGDALAATKPATAGLRPLWEANAAARCLPLLECLARKDKATLAVPYGPRGWLELAVTPC